MVLPASRSASSSSEWKSATVVVEVEHRFTCSIALEISGATLWVAIIVEKEGEKEGEKGRESSVDFR